MNPAEYISIFYRSTILFCQENAFEYVVWKMAAIFSRLDVLIVPLGVSTGDNFVVTQTVNCDYCS